MEASKVLIAIEQQHVLTVLLVNYISLRMSLPSSGAPPYTLTKAFSLTLIIYFACIFLKMKYKKGFKAARLPIP